jgi:hypothetical protein
LKITCVFLFLANFVCNISYSKKMWARYNHNIYWSSLKVLSILVIFWWKLNFVDRFSKNAQISNFVKIRSVGFEFLRADGGTKRRSNMKKLMVASRIFQTLPKTVTLFYSLLKSY